MQALDLITHPAPQRAADAYNRVSLLRPAMCQAVACVRLPTLTSALTLPSAEGVRQGPGTWRFRGP
jgi:hypothetical protein